MRTLSSESTLWDVLTERIADRGLASLASIQRQRSDYSTSAPIDELTVELTDGTRFELMAKKVGPNALLEPARRAKPAFAHSLSREPLVYAHLAGETGPPECWGVADEADGPLLILERVPGLALRHIGKLSSWQAAAAWLATFHRGPAGGSAALPAALRRHLLRHDGSHHEALLERAAQIATVSGRPLPAYVVAQHARAIEILDALPTTLIHGEFYASNVIVDHSTSPPRIAPVDWEMAGTGSPFLDLAALVSGEWSTAQRRAMVDAYRQACVQDLSPEEFDHALVAAELLISVQWMGWAEGWQPPAELAGDWRSNAELTAAVLLGNGSITTRAERGLIVNADDLGLSEGVNRGIFEAHDHGIVTSASLMVRGAAAEAGVAGAVQRPALAIGLHVDLGEWRFADGAWEATYEVVDCHDPDEVHHEVSEQLARFQVLVGRDPTHIDSHQHVHREPVVAAVLADVSQRLGVPLRGAGPIGYLGAFYGQLSKGEPYPEGITVDHLVQLIKGLPAGVTELGCHPGYADASTSVYAEERFLELQALCDPLVTQAVERGCVRLLSFANLRR